MVEALVSTHTTKRILYWQLLGNIIDLSLWLLDAPSLYKNSDALK